MTKRLLVFAALVASAVMMNGCMTSGGEAARDPAAETESTATSELTQQICFTCDLDPSIHSCSSIASRAQHICQRACIVCDDFGDNIGECFVGSCAPDL